MQHRITPYSSKLGSLCAVAVALNACSNASQSTTSPELRASREAVEAEALTFTSFVVPGAGVAFPLDINSHGEVVGRFASGGVTHGFLRSAEGDFTTIDYPGALSTVAFGINNEGDIVGTYAMVTVPGPLDERHGFLLHHGEFTSFDPEGSKFTNPLGINARGDIVGRFCTALPCGRPGSGNYHGFLWHDGEATTIDVPGSRETNAWKITAEGQIVGGFRMSGGPNRLFTLQGSEFVTFDLPGGLPVAQDNGGINAQGDIVGSYCNASPCDLTNAGNHGFVLRRGELTTVDFPGANATGAFGINARGDVAGSYNDGTNHGFILTRHP